MIVSILGAGGHGRDLAEVAYQLGHEVAYYDDGPNPYPMLREHDGSLAYVIGVNNPHVRRRLALGSAPTRLVHPSATVAPSAEISPGCVVGAGTTVGPGTVLGPHVHIGPGCTVTRTTVGDFTTIAPGVDIAGDVTIGRECLIGVGAVISNLCSIGDHCVIGAGSVVVRDFGPNQIVAGVPAKSLTPEGVPA